MFDPLVLKKEYHVDISVHDKSYHVGGLENFSDFENLNTARYLLKQKNSRERNILEAKKDSSNNFYLSYYKLVEKLQFDFSFFSLLGTSTLAYKHPKYLDKYIIYDKISKPNENYETLKVLADKEQMPIQNGYFQDGNNNWYFLVKKYQGSIKKAIHKKAKRYWEYQDKNKNTLVIETELFNSIQEYTNSQPNIYVYEKKILKRKDVKILARVKEYI